RPAPRRSRPERRSSVSRPRPGPRRRCASRRARRRCRRGPRAAGPRPAPPGRRRPPARAGSRGTARCGWRGPGAPAAAAAAAHGRPARCAPATTRASRPGPARRGRRRRRSAGRAPGGAGTPPAAASPTGRRGAGCRRRRSGGWGRCRPGCGGAGSRPGRAGRGRRPGGGSSPRARRRGWVVRPPRPAASAAGGHDEAPLSGPVRPATGRAPPPRRQTYEPRVARLFRSDEPLTTLGWRASRRPWPGADGPARRPGTADGRPLCCADMAREEYLNHLDLVPVFSGLTTTALREIANAHGALTHDEGREFVTQGDVGREAFVIVEGTAEVVRAGEVIATLGPGDCVGELALLDHGPRTASVRAKTPLTVLVLGPREFSGLLDEVPALTHKILASLASRVRELDSKPYG